MQSRRALVLAVLVAGCSGDRARTPELVFEPASGPVAGRMPAPTEHWLDEDAEADQKAARKRWFAEMHRAAPDVDWRAIERENGAREQERRNRIARSGNLASAPDLWDEVGSKNQAGRMLCAVIGPDGQTLYAGSALGGVWRGGLDGSNWTPLGDNLYGGADHLVVLPGELAGEPDVIVAFTGGREVRVTRDQGLTWETPTGIASVNSVRGVALLAATNTILFLGQTSQLGNSPALFASTDFGRSFAKRWQAPQSGSGAMWVPRIGPGAASTVYVSNRGRVEVSTDGGASFAPLATVDSTSDASLLTGSEAGAPTLYLALRAAGAWKLYRSDDGGASFAFVHSPGDFWEVMCASITDPSVVVYGGVEAFRSTSGGASFAKINNWGDYYGDPLHKLHADIQGLFAWPDPQSPGDELWYLCTDGGVYESHAHGASPLNLALSGLGVSQYYSTLTSSSNTSLVLAGSQDQGYQRGNVQPPLPSGPSTPFNQLISGDYGHLTSSDGTHALVYSTYPGFILVQSGQTNPQLYFVDFPTGASNAWLPPVVADPLDSTSFFFCAERLYRYTRATTSTWNYVQHSTHDFAAGSGNYLSALAFAPTDAQRAYAANDAGKLFYSTNHGTTWTQAASSAPGEHYFYGNAIAVHPSNALEAAVGGSGYSTAGVVRTQDGGVTWQPETSGLPQTLVYALVYARDGTGDLYAGTETGAYRWRRASGTWENVMSNQAPITIYWSVEAVGTDTIRYGTYGRGIWDHKLPPGDTASYCTGKLNSHGCAPAMAGTGIPSASSPTAFDVRATLVVNNKAGLLFYGLGPNAAPFQGGFLCVLPPTKRTPVQSSGGNPPPDYCSGSFSFDFNARVQSGLDPDLAAGVKVYCQYWYRDPAMASTTGLSDGLSFTILP